MDLTDLGAFKSKDDKFVKIHRIRKLEQKIVALVNIFFSCKTTEARQETMNELRETNETLTDLEAME